MEKSNQKKALVLSIVGVITLIIAVVGATYAYFTAQGGGTGNINVDATTNTTDNLSFQTGESISLTANQEDFGSGMGNKSGSTFARATLTANNSTNNATRNYYVYLDITDNNFEYTTEDNQAEILLKVTDPDGSEVTNIPGLTRKTSGSGENEVTGFDITTSKAFIEIADNYEIISTGTVTQEWTVEIIFVNLDSDQNANTNKKFNANLVIQEEETLTLANYIINDVYTKDGVSGLYYHDGLGSYVNADQEAGDYSYRYSGGDYQVTETATVAGLTRVYTAASAETDGVINFYCNGEKQFVGYNCNSTQEHYYTTAYNESTHYNALEEVLSQAVSDGYLTADNIKNYVCFGPGAENEQCPEDNLYRIIGVFDGQVKLIKYDYANITMLGADGDYRQLDTTVFWSGMRKNAESVQRYYWDYSNGDDSTNEWSKSRLNTVNLNTNYWNYLTGDWQSKIANTIWQIGGNTAENIKDVSAKTVYINEIVNPSVETKYQDEIGLMYVNDYAYALSPVSWTNNSNSSNYYREVKENTWMYAGFTDWAITPCVDYACSAFYIDYRGNATTYTQFISGSVRPVFYLNSDVQIYEGHAGTASDPYRIVI